MAFGIGERVLGSIGTNNVGTVIKPADPYGVVEILLDRNGRNERWHESSLVAMSKTYSRLPVSLRNGAVVEVYEKTMYFREVGARLALRNAWNDTQSAMYFTDYSSIGNEENFRALGLPREVGSELPLPHLPNELPKGTRFQVTADTQDFKQGQTLTLAEPWTQSTERFGEMYFLEIPGVYIMKENLMSLLPITGVTLFKKGAFVKVTAKSESWVEAEIGTCAQVVEPWDGTGQLSLKLANGNKAWIHDKASIEVMKLIPETEYVSAALSFNAKKAALVRAPEPKKVWATFATGDEVTILSDYNRALQGKQAEVVGMTGWKGPDGRLEYQVSLGANDMRYYKSDELQKVAPTGIAVGDFVKLKNPLACQPDLEWPNGIEVKKTRAFQVAQIGYGKVYIDLFAQMEQKYGSAARDALYKTWGLPNSELEKVDVLTAAKMNVREMAPMRTAVTVNLRFKVGDEFIIDPNHPDLKNDRNKGKRARITKVPITSGGWYDSVAVTEPLDSFNTKETWMLPVRLLVPQLENKSVAVASIPKVVKFGELIEQEFKATFIPPPTKVEPKEEKMSKETKVAEKVEPKAPPTPAKERIIVVKDVGAGSPAAKAGLSYGDTVVEFAGEIVSKSDKSIKDMVQGAKESLTVVIARKGDRLRKVIHQNFDPEGDLWRNGALFEISETDVGEAKWCENHPDRRGMKFMTAAGHCFCADCKEEFTEERYAKVTAASEALEARAVAAETSLRSANRMKWLKRVAAALLLVGGSGSGVALAHFQEPILLLINTYLNGFIGK